MNPKHLGSEGHRVEHVRSYLKEHIYWSGPRGPHFRLLEAALADKSAAEQLCEGCSTAAQFLHVIEAQISEAEGKQRKPPPPKPPPKAPTSSAQPPQTPQGEAGPIFVD